MVRAARGSGQELRPRDKKVLAWGYWVFRGRATLRVPGCQETCSPAMVPKDSAPAGTAVRREPYSPSGSQTQYVTLTSQVLLDETSAPKFPSVLIRGQEAAGRREGERKCRRENAGNRPIYEHWKSRWPEGLCFGGALLRGSKRTPLGAVLRGPGLHWGLRPSSELRCRRLSMDGSVCTSSDGHLPVFLSCCFAIGTDLGPHLQAG